MTPSPALAVPATVAASFLELAASRLRRAASLAIAGDTEGALEAQRQADHALDQARAAIEAAP